MILAVALIVALVIYCTGGTGGGSNSHTVQSTLAQILRYCVEHQLLERYTVADTVALVQKEVAKGGLSALSDSSYAAMGLCMPRVQEIFACINRYRG